MGNPLDRYLAGPDKDKTNPLDDYLDQEGAPTSVDTQGASYEDKSGGATAGAVEGVKDFVSNVGALGKGAVEAFTTPGKMGEIVSEGGSAIGGMVRHPLVTAKNILWDGLAVPMFVNPMEIVFDRHWTTTDKLTPEEKYDKAKATSATAIGLAIGEGFGRAIGMLGKGRVAAGGLEKLTGARTAEEVVDHIASISDAKTALLTRDLALKARNGGMLRSAARIGATGFGAGFGQGTAMSDDPDQAFKQGVVGGMAGAFLGIGLHSVKGKTPFKGVADLALDKAKELMLPDVLKAAPGHALEDMYNGVDFVNLAAKHIPEGETHALYDIPESSVKEKLPENAIVRKKNNGKVDVLIVGKDAIKQSDLYNHPAMGKELHTDVFDPTFADENGNPAKLASKGDKIDEPLLAKLQSVGYEKLYNEHGEGVIDVSKEAKHPTNIINNPDAKVPKNIVGAIADQLDSIHHSTPVDWDLNTTKTLLNSVPNISQFINHALNYLSNAEINGALAKFGVKFKTNKVGKFEFEAIKPLESIYGDKLLWKSGEAPPTLLHHELHVAALKHNKGTPGNPPYSPEYISKLFQSALKLGKVDGLYTVAKSILGEAETKTIANELGFNFVKELGSQKYALTKPGTLAPEGWSEVEGTNSKLAPPKSGQLDPKVIKHWQDTGFVPNQLIEYKGVEHQLNQVFIRGGGGLKDEAVLTRLTDGKEVTVKLDQLQAASGRVKQVRYMNIKNAFDQNPSSLSEAYGPMQMWLEDVHNKHINGEQVDLSNVPPMAVVRWQNKNFGDEPLYSKHRKNTYYSFADQNGTNFEYKKTVYEGSEYAEGGDKALYVLAKLGEKPLFLLGGDARPGFTGRAILGKIKPEWSHQNIMEPGSNSLNKTGQDIVNYLTTKLQDDPEGTAWLEQNLKNSGFRSWDRLGSEVAKDMGYTDVINVDDPSNPSGFGNEFVKLNPPETYKEIEIRHRNNLPIDVKHYNEALKESKFAEVVKEDPEAALVYQRNKGMLDRQDLEAAQQTVNAAAEAGMTFEPTSEGNLWVVDKTGKRVFLADDLKAAQEYTTKLPNSGGDNLIPSPPDRGVAMVPFDDASSFALNQKRNAMNAARDWYNKRFSNVAVPYSYFTTLESTTGKRFLNDFFLPLQKAKARFNAEIQPLVERVNKGLTHLQPLNADRRGKVAGALTTASVNEMLGDTPTILGRVLTDGEKRLGKGLSEISTSEDRAAAYKYIRAQKELAENMKVASDADRIMLQDDFNRSWQLSDAQQKVVQMFKDIKREDIDKMSLNAVNELADGYNNGSMSQAEYMDHHKFSKQERQAVKDIEKLYKELAPVFGISPHSRIARYLTKVVQFDGNVPNGSIILNDRFISAKDRSFIYALTRSGENRNVLTDPAEILQRYVMHGMKDKYLYPEVKAAKDFLRNAYQGMDSRVATEIHEKAAQYLSEIIGSRNPNDALALARDVEAPTGAFIKSLQALGVDEGTSSKWLANYFKVSELATQGYKPIAGIRDTVAPLAHYYVRFGTAGVLRLMSNWNAALENKTILRAKGTIPGLTIEFYNALEQSSNKTLLDKVANAGFKMSGQPWVYEQFHAMVYLERTKTVGEAINALSEGKITQKKFESRIGLHTYDKPVVSEFTRRMRSGPNGAQEATKYLADITGREVVGVYGMANHPFFMGSKKGKVLGQHGQWPLWMLQNFGRLASQGTRSQRLVTAAKIAGLAAAFNIGGRAAGFNLSSWSFDPSNAIFIPGYSSPLGQVGFWGAVYLGSNDPSQREYAGRMLERNTQLQRSQFFLPMPAQAYNILWGVARSGQEDPAHIIGGQILGIPIDTRQYPKPPSLLDELGMEDATDAISEMKGSIGESVADIKESMSFGE